MRRRAVAAVVSAVALAACGGSNTRSAAQQSCPRPPAGDHRLDAGTVLHVPPGGGRRPLLIVLHGAGGSGPEAERTFKVNPVADREGYLVLYPSAAAHHFWELNHTGSHDEVGRIRARLAEAERVACFDPGRVYATGVSNGGGFSARLACEMSDRIAAAAPIAGSYKELDPCRPDRPVAILEIHGTSDAIVPYRSSAPGYVAAWARRDHCRARPRRSTPRRGVVRLRWSGCAQGVAVEHLRLAGTGHGWPGVIAFQGRDPTGLSATREIFRFLRGRRLTDPG